MRVAIYARHSTDSQTTSSQDQILRCEGYCEAKQYSIEDVYFDEAFSGAHMENRPGINNLLMGAFDGRFDRIITEDLSRISRDQADTANFFKKMVFLGIDVETITEGVIGELHIGLKSTMNALYLKDLSDKTHRGMIASVLRGSVPGGRTFGYEIVRALDGNSELIRGKRRIVEEEAEIIREIFKLYSTGSKLQHICTILDRKGIAAPSGGKWAPTTLVGSRIRKTGLLRNTLYKGVVTFNRMQYRKHPETGKKLAVLRPESEWIQVPVPELQIIDEQEFDAIQAQLDERSSKVAEYRKTASLRSPEETEQISKTRIKHWRQRQIKSTGKVVAVFAGRLRCAQHDTTIKAAWADRYSCKKKGCPNRAVRYEELCDIIIREAMRLTCADIETHYGHEAIAERRSRLEKQISEAEQKLQGMRDRAAHALNTFKVNSDSAELKAWFDDNTEQMRLVKLEIARLKRSLEEMKAPANIADIHKRFSALISRLQVWSREPETVSQLRHVMKRYIITAHWDHVDLRWHRTCKIEYDFEAMARVLGKKK